MSGGQGYALQKVDTAPQEPDKRDIREIQKMNDGLYKISSYMSRSRRFFVTLADVANLADARTMPDALQVVTEERQWMFKQMNLLGSFVGTFYALEKNIMQELETYYETATGAAPMSMQKRNAEATLENIEVLMEQQQKCKQLISDVQNLSNKVKEFEGGNETVHEMAIKKIGTYAGAEVAMKMLDDVKNKMKEMEDKQKEIVEITEKLPEAQANIAEAAAKYIINEQIANNERGKMAKMNEAAQAIENDAKKRAAVSADTLNLATKVTVGGQTLYDYNDNKGEAEKLRAEKLRALAKEAAQDDRAQAEKAEEAQTKMAAAKREVEVSTEEKLQLMKSLTAAQNDLKEIRKELKELETECKELAKEMGGTNLWAVAEMRHQMQQLPEVIAVINSEGDSMFASMEGHLDKFQMLKNRMSKFLTCKSDAEALDALQAVKPTLKLALEGAQFYQGHMGEVTDKIKKNMQELAYAQKHQPIADQPTTTTTTTTPTDSMSGPDAEQVTEKVNQLVSIDDEEDPW